MEGDGRTGGEGPMSITDDTDLYHPTQDELVSQAESDVSTQAVTDLAYTQREAMSDLVESDQVPGYWRVTSGSGCEFCELISTQLYHTDDLMEVHPNCECSVDVADESEISEHGTARAPEEDVPEEEPDRDLSFIEIKGATGNAGDNISQALQDSFRGLDLRKLYDLREVNVVRSINQNPRTQAMYFSDGRILVRKDIIDPKARAQAMEDLMVKDGWFVPTNATVDQQALMHETGHYLYDQLNGTDKMRLFKIMNTTAGKDGIAKAVSQYASTDTHEAMAEIWAEYRLSAKPRPVAAAVGKAWEAMLGGAA